MMGVGIKSMENVRAVRQFEHVIRDLNACLARNAKFKQEGVTKYFVLYFAVEAKTVSFKSDYFVMIV
jgi:hypothetical protein